MPYIRNRSELLSHGHAVARRDALDLVDAGLAAADPYPAVRHLVSVRGDRLMVGGLDLGLSGRRILFLGAGKASLRIALALEDVLGDRIADGIVVAREAGGAPERTPQRIRLRLAGHPLPDRAGLEAAREVAALAGATGPGDLVLCGMTGGSSALLPLPLDGVTLGEKRTVTRLLLDRGAPIRDINAVRKHLSRIKGGRLAETIHPAARLVNLTVSGVAGDPPDLITGPTVPDPSTLRDARAALDRHRLWSRVPASVRATLSEGGAPETPEELGERVLGTFVVVAGTAACEGAVRRARELGLTGILHSTELEGDSREAGVTFAGLARELVGSGRARERPVAVIAGGETTVRIDGRRGEGGPNQEFAVAAAPGIASLDPELEVVVVGLDTDGADGPTAWAGGIVDGRTAERAREADVDLEASLRRHDASSALRALGDAVDTGSTGTNVNDLKILVVRPRRP